MDRLQLPQDKRTWMPAYAISMEVITTILLGIRLLSRFQRTGGRLGLDDFFITMGWAIATINNGCVLLYAFKYGLGEHIWNLSRFQLEKAALLSWLISGLFLWSNAFTKISVLLFYRRLVAGTCSKRFRWALWSAILFIATYTIVMFILLFTACTPIEALWRKLDPKYKQTFHCAPQKVQAGISELSGALSVFSDIYSVMLPAMLLFKLKTTTRQRAGLIFVFGLGILTVVAGIVRTVYLGIVKSNRVDKTWLTFNVFVAAMAEENIAIVCACAPSIKSFFRSYFRDHFPPKGTSAGIYTGNKSTESAQALRANRVPSGKGSWKWGPVLVERSFDVKHEVVRGYGSSKTKSIISVSTVESKSLPQSPNSIPLDWMDKKDMEPGRMSPTSWLSTTNEEDDRRAERKWPKKSNTTKD